MFRDILVHVDGSESGRRRLHFAVDFALRSGARLSGVHVTPPAEVPPRYKPTRVADIAAHLSSQLALDAQAAATAFSEEVAGRLADSCWFSAEGNIVPQATVEGFVLADSRFNSAQPRASAHTERAKTPGNGGQDSGG